MVIRVYFKHMTSSRALHAYAEQKIGERIDKYGIDATEAHVTFAIENGIRTASAHVVAPNNVSITVVDYDTSNMYAAIDGLSDKLDARLRRCKEKMRSHRERTAIDIVPTAEAQRSTPPEDAIDAGYIIALEKKRANAERYG